MSGNFIDEDENEDEDEDRRPFGVEALEEMDLLCFEQDKLSTS